MEGGEGGRPSLSFLLGRPQGDSGATQGPARPEQCPQPGPRRHRHRGRCPGTKARRAARDRAGRGRSLAAGTLLRLRLLLGRPSSSYRPFGGFNKIKRIKGRRGGGAGGGDSPLRGWDPGRPRPRPARRARSPHWHSRRAPRARPRRPSPARGTAAHCSRGPRRAARFACAPVTKGQGQERGPPGPARPGAAPRPAAGTPGPRARAAPAREWRSPAAV